MIWVYRGVGETIRAERQSTLGLSWLQVVRGPTSSLCSSPSLTLSLSLSFPFGETVCERDFKLSKEIVCELVPYVVGIQLVKLRQWKVWPEIYLKFFFLLVFFSSCCCPAQLFTCLVSRQLGRAMFSFFIIKKYRAFFLNGCPTAPLE